MAWTFGDTATFQRLGEDGRESGQEQSGRVGSLLAVLTRSWASHDDGRLMTFVRLTMVGSWSRMTWRTRLAEFRLHGRVSEAKGRRCRLPFLILFCGTCVHLMHHIHFLVGVLGFIEGRAESSLVLSEVAFSVAMDPGRVSTMSCRCVERVTRLNPWCKGDDGVAQPSIFDATRMLLGPGHLGFSRPMCVNTYKADKMIFPRNTWRLAFVRRARLQHERARWTRCQQ